MSSVVALMGQISLNVSFLLYMIVYIPQLWHNRKPEHIAELSLSLHILLYVSFVFDLLYGFAAGMPWQYKAVDIVGCILISIQHWQLTSFFIKEKLFSQNIINTFFFLFLLGSLFYFSWMPNDADTVVFLGTVSRGLGLVYCIPQIIKNQYLRSAQAMSLFYMYLNLLLAFLDSVSAWCLDWGWPNKIASPITILVMLILLLQGYAYTSGFSKLLDQKNQLA